MKDACYRGHSSSFNLMALPFVVRSTSTMKLWHATNWKSTTLSPIIVYCSPATRSYCGASQLLDCLSAGCLCRFIKHQPLSITAKPCGKPVSHIAPPSCRRKQYSPSPPALPPSPTAIPAVARRQETPSRLRETIPRRRLLACFVGALHHICLCCGLWVCTPRTAVFWYEASTYHSHKRDH